MKLMHISDLHFGPTFVPEAGRALVRKAEEEKPDIIVVSGDITQRARSEQFAEAKEYFAGLGRISDKVLIVPGNHDAPLYNVFMRLAAPYQRYREFIGPEHDRFVQVGDIDFLCLNSTHPRMRIKRGLVRLRQFNKTIEHFADASPDRFKVVVMHHHLFPIPGYKIRLPMRRGKSYLELLTELKVDMVLSGHIHRSYIGNSLDVFTGKDRQHGVLVVSCGTSTSRRGRGKEREKNSLNIIEMGRDEIFVRHCMYFSGADRFDNLSSHTFPRAH